MGAKVIIPIETEGAETDECNLDSGLAYLIARKLEVPAFYQQRTV